MPTPRDYLDHIAGVWARSGTQQHNHHNGWENCPVCSKHDPAAKHDHNLGLDSCRACMRITAPTCGNPTCPICA